MFSWSNKKDISIFRMEKAPYLLLCIYRYRYRFRKKKLRFTDRILNWKKGERKKVADLPTMANWWWNRKQNIFRPNKSSARYSIAFIEICVSPSTPILWSIKSTFGMMIDSDPKDLSPMPVTLKLSHRPRIFMLKFWLGSFWETFNLMINLVYIWYDGRYWSMVFISTIFSHTRCLEVKVFNLSLGLKVIKNLFLSNLLKNLFIFEILIQNFY